MSRTKIVLAGEGGQGVQSIAKILVEAGYEAGKQVLYIPFKYVLFKRNIYHF